MHMADALLSPAVGVTFWAASVGGITYSVRKLKDKIDEKMIPLMGVLGAFVFAAQMINFTIPATGSSGHLGGGLLLSVILGPYAAFIVMASVLIIQALFFADGGLLALGCNIWNLGFYTCFIAYPFIFKPIAKTLDDKKLILASILAAVIGLQLGAFSVVIETLLSGKSELPFSTFLLLMQPIHLAIGIVEGVVTAAVIKFVKVARPEVLETNLGQRPLPSNLPIKNLFVGFLLVAVLTGGLLSWFASENPDGLEWSIEKVYGKPELPEQESGLVAVLKNIQEKVAFLPDYTFKKAEKTEEPKASVESDKGEKSIANIDVGTSLSGILGSLIVLLVVFGTGFVIKTFRKKTA
ncbi:MAG: energy-coupling factor ABC transporter permease [bacterium]